MKASCFLLQSCYFLYHQVMVEFKEYLFPHKYFTVLFLKALLAYLQIVKHTLPFRSYFSLHFTVLNNIKSPISTFNTPNLHLIQFSKQTMLQVHLCNRCAILDSFFIWNIFPHLPSWIISLCPSILIFCQETFLLYTPPQS